MKDKKIVLITGAAGFIGSFLVRKFLASGYKVIGIDDINNYYDKNLKLQRLKNIKEYSILKNSSWLFYEISIEDKKNMQKIFLDTKPEIVVNLAAQAGVRYSIEKPRTYLSSNIIGTYNVIEIAHKAKVKHLFGNF